MTENVSVGLCTLLLSRETFEELHSEFVSGASSISLHRDAFFQALIAVEEFSREPVCSLLFG